MKMTDILQMNMRFMTAAQVVGTRRMVQGPLLPSWSWWFESVLQLLRANVPQGHQIPAHQVRELMDQIVHPPLGRDVAIRPADELPVPGEWVTAGAAHAERLILYLHGGGYVAGSPQSYRGLTTAIARACGTRLLVLDYRLAPEHPFPAPLEDVCAVYTWLLAHNVNPEQIVFAGDSAGGGLAIAALTVLRDAGLPLPKAAVCISPWLDLSMESESIHTNSGIDYLNRDIVTACARMYLHGAAPQTPQASPLYADLHGLPPLLLQIGSAELFCDEGRLFAEHARAANVDVTLEVWEDMIHDWHMLHWLEPKARAAIARIGEFVEQTLL